MDCRQENNKSNAACRQDKCDRTAKHWLARNLEELEDLRDRLHRFTVLSGPPVPANALV